MKKMHFHEDESEYLKQKLCYIYVNVINLYKYIFIYISSYELVTFKFDNNA